MTYIAVCAVVLIASAFLAPASVRADDAAAVRQIQDSLEKLKDGFVNKNGETIREIMTPDALLTTPFYGAPFSVDEVVSHLGVFDIESHESHDLKIEMLGSETAVMTLYTSFKGTFDGKPLPPWVFASAVWVRDGETWRVKNYQETTVNAPR